MQGINELLKFLKLKSTREFVVSETIQLIMMGETNEKRVDGIMRERERKRKRERERENARCRADVTKYRNRYITFEV